jgi:co-chaperonin GroES (HSP10)
MVAVAKTVHNFEPLHDYVLLKPIAQGRTPGGVFVPEGTEVEPPTATVMAVGPDVGEEGKEKPLKPGDVVYRMSQSYSPPIELELDGENYVMLHFNELIARKAGK